MNQFSKRKYKPEGYRVIKRKRGIRQTGKCFCGEISLSYSALCATCHRESQRKKANKKRASIRDIIHKLKNIPCMDCGVIYPPCAMDFDHRPGTKKKASVAQLIARMVKLKEIMAEIRKCDVVCSNCHRIRTYNRRNNKQ